MSISSDLNTKLRLKGKASLLQARVIKEHSSRSEQESSRKPILKTKIMKNFLYYRQRSHNR